MQKYSQAIEFAPIGLIKMYNSGGAVKSMEFFEDEDLRLNIKGRGSGLFGAYSTREPRTCTVNSKEVDFKFSSKDNFLTLTIPLQRKSWTLDLYY